MDVAWSSSKRKRFQGFISVALIVFGAFVAGAQDLSFDAYGYTIALSNVATAVYLATIARIGKSSGLNSFGSMWCNGLVCGPISLFWTYFHGDLELTMNFPHLYSPGFQVVPLTVNHIGEDNSLDLLINGESSSSYINIQIVGATIDCQSQPSKDWATGIQHEWKFLEKDLPG